MARREPGRLGKKSSLHIIFHVIFLPSSPPPSPEPSTHTTRGWDFCFEVTVLCTQWQGEESFTKGKKRDVKGGMVQILRNFLSCRIERIERKRVLFCAQDRGNRGGRTTKRKTKQENKCIEKQEGLALLIRRVSDEKWCSSRRREPMVLGWVYCVGFAPSAAQKQKGMVGTDYI